MEIQRVWAMPNSKTFTIKPIKQLIKDELIKGVVLDPFANDQSIKEVMTDEQRYISNDLDTSFDTDYHLDALDFLKLFDDESVDMVLYDPPYSPRQVSEVYKAMDRTVNMQTTQASYWTNQKKTKLREY